MRINEVKYEKLKTPLKVNGNLNLCFPLGHYEVPLVYGGLSLYAISVESIVVCFLLKYKNQTKPTRTLGVSHYTFFSYTSVT